MIYTMLFLSQLCHFEVFRPGVFGCFTEGYLSKELTYQNPQIISMVYPILHPLGAFVHRVCVELFSPTS
jgi:hypothetical protein